MISASSDENQAGKFSTPTTDALHSETANSAASYHPDLPPAQEAAAATDEKGDANTTNEPPLPDEEAPPLPDEPPPNAADDGWEAKWEEAAKAWYFYNHRTGVTQWENPRLPAATVYSHGPYDRNPASNAAIYTTTSGAPGTMSPPKRKWGGYNPAIHGSYDPNADYAQEASKEEEDDEQSTAATAAAAGMSTQEYIAQAQFNRFTGKFQQAGVGPEMHNDENKSKRQMTAFFDVDAAANSHDGRSLKAERRGKTLSKKELKAFKEKRHSKKEEKRRAWLRD